MKDRIKRWICSGRKKRLEEETRKQWLDIRNAVYESVLRKSIMQEEAAVQDRELPESVAEIEWIEDDQQYRCWVTVNNNPICAFRFTNFVRRGRNIYFYNGNETVDDNYCGVAWGNDIDVRIVNMTEKE